jgi:hypothetical protein
VAIIPLKDNSQICLLHDRQIFNQLSILMATHSKYLNLAIFAIFSHLGQLKPSKSNHFRLFSLKFWRNFTSRLVPLGLRASLVGDEKKQNIKNGFYPMFFFPSFCFLVNGEHPKRDVELNGE